MNVAPPHPFCATCLSPGRKMYYAKYYSPPYFDLIRSFILSENDGICWECHNFVLKMGAFRYKAWRAQSCLIAFFNRQPVQLETFSKLVRSSNVCFTITKPQENIKPDLVKTEQDPMDISDVRDVMTSCRVFGHTRDGVIEVRQEHNEPEPHDTPNSEVTEGTTAPEATSPAAYPAETPDNSFKIRLPYKPPETNSETVNSNAKENSTDTEETKERRAEGPIFTEERLTEEEMEKWRDGKRESKFYSYFMKRRRCEMCVQPLHISGKWWFKTHMQMHEEMYGDLMCDVCKLRFNDQDMLTAHKNTHNSLLKCGSCDLVWDNPNAMRMHCEQAHGIPVNMWNCDICGWDLKPTNQRHHHSHRLVECPECNKKVNVYNIRSHMNLHEMGAEKPYACDCGRKFETNTLLIRHMRIHDKKEAYCTECNKKFRDMSAYKSHMRFAKRHVPEDLLRFACEECGHRFVSKGFLNKHVKDKHEERRYNCKRCNTTLTSKVGYQIHMKKHDGYVDPKDKICDYCGKAFRSKVVLTDHINSHTGWRPYKCRLCRDTFGHKSAHYLHMRFKHKIPKKNSKKD